MKSCTTNTQKHTKSHTHKTGGLLSETISTSLIFLKKKKGEKEGERGRKREKEGERGRKREKEGERGERVRGEKVVVEGRGKMEMRKETGGKSLPRSNISC